MNTYFFVKLKTRSLFNDYLYGIIFVSIYLILLTNKTKFKLSDAKKSTLKLIQAMSIL